MLLDVKAEDVGFQAGEELVRNLEQRGCVDDFMQDQVNILKPSNIQNSICYTLFTFLGYIIITCLSHYLQILYSLHMKQQWNNLITGAAIFLLNICVQNAFR